MNSNRTQHTNQHGSTIEAVFKRGWVHYKQEVRRLILGITNPLFCACQNYPDPNIIIILVPKSESSTLPESLFLNPKSHSHTS